MTRDSLQGFVAGDAVNTTARLKLVAPLMNVVVGRASRPHESIHRIRGARTIQCERQVEVDALAGPVTAGQRGVEAHGRAPPWITALCDLTLEGWGRSYRVLHKGGHLARACLLYTSDA